MGGLNALSANTEINTICSDVAGNVYTAGNFTNGATVISGDRYVAHWNGTNWSELGGGVNALGANQAIYSIYISPSGKIYAGGAFYNSSGFKYVATFQTTTGVNATLTKYELNLFPNPADKQLRLQGIAPGIKSISLYDVTGKSLFYQEVLNRQDITIDVSRLDPGIYYLEANTPGGRKRKKVVKI